MVTPHAEKSWCSYWTLLYPARLKLQRRIRLEPWQQYTQRRQAARVLDALEVRE